MYRCVCKQVDNYPSTATAHLSKPISTCRKSFTVQQSARIFIRVDNLETAESRFSLDVPVEMVKVGLAVARGFSRKLARLNWQDLQTKIADTCVGTLLDECDDTNNERILIYVENPKWS